MGNSQSDEGRVPYQEDYDRTHWSSNETPTTMKTISQPHSKPFQVAIFIPNHQGSHFVCGGSLISPTTVLTAAHCINKRAGLPEVVLGAHNFLDDESSRIKIKASKVIVHPQYDGRSHKNDIAIIRLARSVPLNEYIQVIKVPSRADRRKNYSGDRATASGWGWPSDNVHQPSNILREVTLPVIDNSTCSSLLKLGIEDTNVCTSGADGKSVCYGDSGGPLVASTGVLIGVTSFGSGKGCGKGFPTAFTRVTEYLDWIEDNSDVTIY